MASLEPECFLNIYPIQNTDLLKYSASAFIQFPKASNDLFIFDPSPLKKMKILPIS